MPAVGNGTTITFASGSFPATLTSITNSGVSRESIETTTLATTNAKTYIPGFLVDNGELSVEGYWDGTEPPSAAEATTVTVAVPISTSATKSIAGNGFVTQWSWGSPLEELVAFSATIKWAGAVTIS